MVPDITSPLKSKQQQSFSLSNTNSTTSSPESSENIRYNTNHHHHHNNSNSNNNFQNHHQTSQSFDSRLPIIKVKNQLIKRLTQHETLIIIGETGSGKTTQIPQFFLEIFTFKHQHSANSIQNGDIKTSSFKGMIGITQPRRVAAVSLSNRVANEIGTKIGDLVGYKIRFEESLSARTKIKYMTDGILLREAITDPLLSNYRVIILDEVHERTVQIDVLLGIVKKAQRLRNKKRFLGDNSNLNNENNLKVVIMSATMDVDNFARYFDNAPVYYVEGRLFPIEIFYTEQKQNDYMAAALSTLFQIHQNEDELMVTDKNSQQKKHLSYGGDVLVFCTGQEEIESMIKVVNDLAPQINMMKTAKGLVKTLKPYPLYSALPMNRQQQIFFRNANDCFRRVIFATNIAETSITIPNIRFVIDTGKFKSKVYSPKTGLEIMSVENISKTQACQRSGRAGRLTSGNCYRLYTRQEYKSLSSFPVPEIQKCNLSSVLLQMIASGITNIQEFDFIDPPSSDIIQTSLSQLILMKAIEKFKDNSIESTSSSSSSSSSSQQYKLTRIGQLMVSFPVDPRFAILIIRAVKFGCTEEIITIISMLSVDNVFIMTNSERDAVLAMHRKFASSEGDLIKLLKVFRKYKESKQSYSWCQENFLRPVQLKTAAEIRQQLMEICRSLNIPIVNCNNTEIVRKCLAIGAGVGIGLGSNVALLQRDGNYHTIQLNKCNNQINVQQIVHIHPSSCLFSHSNKPECVLFVELVQTTKSYMRNLCLIDREWLMEQSFINHINNDNDNDNL